MSLRDRAEQSQGRRTKGTIDRLLDRLDGDELAEAMDLIMGEPRVSSTAAAAVLSEEFDVHVSHQMVRTWRMTH